jgi:AraC-like DNA-binding protein
MPVLVSTGLVLDGEATIPTQGGVDGFHPKEIAAVDWITRLSQFPDVSIAWVREAAASEGGSAEHSVWTSNVLAMFDRFMPASGDWQRWLDDCSQVLLPTLVDPRTTVRDFLAAAAAFRLVVAPGLPASETTVETARLLVMAATQLDTRVLRPKVSDALSRLEAGAAEAATLTIARLGSDLYVDGAHLGRQLFEDTGLHWREWKLGARLRGAVRALVGERAAISAIGARWAWSSPQQFSRQFRAVIGLSPVTFRSTAVRRNRVLGLGTQELTK